MALREGWERVKREQVLSEGGCFPDASTGDSIPPHNTVLFAPDGQSWNQLLFKPLKYALT